MATLISRNTLQTARRQGIYATSVAIQICQSSSQSRVIKKPTTASLRRGTGGRSSFNGIVCTVFGSTGFVGRYVCNSLGKIGTQLIIPYRCDMYDIMHLKLCGDLGQVLFHPFHLRDEESIYKCLKHSNVVVNMIAREYETRNFSYTDVNVDGARTIARIAKEANVERLIHVSALNASPEPKPIIWKEGSAFLKSKWEGECAVKEEFPDATIIRPAQIYGQEDRFISSMLRIWRRTTELLGIPLWKKGKGVEKQPIWVGDVAAGIAAIVQNPDTAGKTYQFVGPNRYDLHELVTWLIKLMTLEEDGGGVYIADIRYSPGFCLKVFLNDLLRTAYPPGDLHWEGLEIQHTSDDVMKHLPTLEDLGINPVTMESRMHWEIVPWMMNRSYMRLVGDFPTIPHPKTIPIA